MKIAKLFSFLAFTLMLTSCCRSTDEVWDDTKTASRHVKRGVSALGGKHGDSGVVVCRSGFYVDDGYYACGEDFIPLPDAENDVSMGNFVARQSSFAPGDPGCAIPGIEAFADPCTIPGLERVFQNISFDYNSNLVKGGENVQTAREIADYMRKHPEVYIFILGHCDQRGAEAYNLALGCRRANAVRNMLLENGVNPDNVFTISYGKERPLVFEEHEEAYSRNRRAEFKIYQK